MQTIFLSAHFGGNTAQVLAEDPVAFHLARPGREVEFLTSFIEYFCSMDPHIVHSLADHSCVAVVHSVGLPGRGAAAAPGTQQPQVGLGGARSSVPPHL